MKLSIITINFNNAEGLRKTIESVVSQTFTDYEYIVIDGASTDESVDVIKQYTDKITYWVSEFDKGIYNAMNKGILKAKGEYCLFLNSGDWLVDEDVIKDFCNACFKEDIVSGNIFLLENEKDNILVKAVSLENITYDFFMNNIIYHQSTFIKRSLLMQCGMYSETYKIVSDWEFFIKALIAQNCTYAHFDRNITYFVKGGVSGQQQWMTLHLQEREKVFKLLPRIHKMYMQNIQTTQNMQSVVNEYMHLKNGSFGFIIRFLLCLKRLKRKQK